MTLKPKLEPHVCGKEAVFLKASMKKGDLGVRNRDLVVQLYVMMYRMCEHPAEKVGPT